MATRTRRVGRDFAFEARAQLVQEGRAEQVARALVGLKLMVIERRVYAQAKKNEVWVADRRSKCYLRREARIANSLVGSPRVVSSIERWLKTVGVGEVGEVSVFDSMVRDEPRSTYWTELVGDLTSGQCMALVLVVYVTLVPDEAERIMTKNGIELESLYRKEFL